MATEVREERVEHPDQQDSYTEVGVSHTENDESYLAIRFYDATNESDSVWQTETPASDFIGMLEDIGCLSYETQAHGVDAENFDDLYGTLGDFYEEADELGISIDELVGLIEFDQLDLPGTARAAWLKATPDSDEYGESYPHRISIYLPNNYFEAAAELFSYSSPYGDEVTEDFLRFAQSEVDRRSGRERGQAGGVY